jgi:ankyrin repeat protein
VELLIKHGAGSADVNAQTMVPMQMSLETADILLHKAVRSSIIDDVELLIKCGADVSAQNERNWTPLHEL